MNSSGTFRGRWRARDWDIWESWNKIISGGSNHIQKWLSQACAVLNQAWAVLSVCGPNKIQKQESKWPFSHISQWKWNVMNFNAPETKRIFAHVPSFIRCICPLRPLLSGAKLHRVQPLKNHTESIYHISHICTNTLHTVIYFNQLETDQDSSQGPTLKAVLSKDSSFRSTVNSSSHPAKW